MKPNFIQPKFKIFFPIKKSRSFEGITPINWNQYLPAGERQKFIFDSECCMTYSAIHIIETKLNQMKATGQIPQPVLDKCTALGYFDDAGSFSFSIQFSAILNGTTPGEGNSFDPVWTGFKTFGLLPKRDLEFTMVNAANDATEKLFWDDYFDPNDITQNMKDKAKKFNDLFNIDYTWIIASGVNGLLMKAYNFIVGQSHLDIIKNNLGNTPVHIAIYPCEGWNTGTVPNCGIAFAQHGVELFLVNGDNSYQIFDTYNPFVKILGTGYIIPYAVVPQITVKQKPICVFNSNLSYGQVSREIASLQSCLTYLGLFTGSVTTYYGDKTAAAVKAFQASQGINPVAEYNCGPRTRAALNALFSK